tara:strand:- start:284 stop:661 length:378 start_codon:yes stop_codon:yes gene_type:complete
MDYTKKQRQAYRRPEELTINKLRLLGISEHSLTASIYYVYNKQRLRLVNTSQEVNRIPAIYEYSIDTINHLQKFSNVSPWSNEFVDPKNLGTSYRRLDLYLDEKDIASLLPGKHTKDKYSLPKVN